MKDISVLTSTTFDIAEISQNVFLGQLRYYGQTPKVIINLCFACKQSVSCSPRKKWFYDDLRHFPTAVGAALEKPLMKNRVKISASFTMLRITDQFCTVEWVVFNALEISTSVGKCSRSLLSYHSSHVAPMQLERLATRKRCQVSQHATVSHSVRRKKVWTRHVGQHARKSRDFVKQKVFSWLGWGITTVNLHMILWCTAK